MEPDEAGAAHTAAAPADRLEKLATSARGWHTIQMAVLGFIGICGVLRTASSPAPRAVQWLAAALAVAALAAACVAIFTVGRVAYPVGDVTDGRQRCAGCRWRRRPAAHRDQAHDSGFDPGGDRRALGLVAGGQHHRCCRRHRHQRPGLVWPARQRASRCRQRPYRQWRHLRAHPGHRPGPPRRAVPVGPAGTHSPANCRRIPARADASGKPCPVTAAGAPGPLNAPEPPIGAVDWRLMAPQWWAQIWAICATRLARCPCSCRWRRWCPLSTGRLTAQCVS